MSSPDFTTTTGASIGGRIAANAGMMGGARAVSALMGLATLIITARALDDQAAFGTVLFVHAYMLFFAEVASFQTWQSLIQFGAKYVQDKDAKGLSRLIKFGAALDGIAALLAYGLAVGLFAALTWVWSRGLSVGPSIDGVDVASLRNYVWAYCLILLVRQISTSIGIFRLFDQFSVLALRALVMPVLRFLGACLALWQGWGIIGFLSVWFVASFVSYLILPILAVRELSRRGLWRDVVAAKINLRPNIIGLWPFVIKANIDSSLGAFKTHFPSLLVMAIFGPAFLAIFRIAEEISRFLSRGVTLMDQVLYPELSRLVADQQTARILPIVTKTAMIIGAVSLAFTAVILLAGPWLVNLGLGEGYEKAPALAVMLILGAILLGVAGPFYPVFYATYQPGRAIWARAIGVMAYVAAFFAVLSWAGQMTPGWAAILAGALELIVVFWMVRRSLRRAATD